MARAQITAHIRSKQRQIIRNLTTELILHEHVTVIKSRKQDVEKLFSQLITWGKMGTLSADRHAMKEITKAKANHSVDNQPLAKLKKLALRYKDRSGGYLRSFLLSPRRGDQATLYRLQLVN